MRSVHFSTIFAYFTFRTRERGDVTHSNHGGHKVLVKSLAIFGVGLDEGVGGATVIEDLVGVEEALLLEEVSKVRVVEKIGSFVVERVHIVVSFGTIGERAIGLPFLCKDWVYVGIIIYSTFEGCTPCLSYSMCTCNVRNRDNVVFYRCDALFFTEQTELEFTIDSI